MELTKEQLELVEIGRAFKEEYGTIKTAKEYREQVRRETASIMSANDKIRAEGEASLKAIKQKELELKQSLEEQAIDIQQKKEAKSEELAEILAQIDGAKSELVAIKEAIVKAREIASNHKKDFDAFVVESQNRIDALVAKEQGLAKAIEDKEDALCVIEASEKQAQETLSTLCDTILEKQAFLEKASFSAMEKMAEKEALSKEVALLQEEKLALSVKDEERAKFEAEQDAFTAKKVEFKKEFDAFQVVKKVVLDEQESIAIKKQLLDKQASDNQRVLKQINETKDALTRGAK